VTGRAQTRTIGHRVMSVTALATVLAGCGSSPSPAVGGPAATGAGVVKNYSDPSISGPNGIATGPDGALWFTNLNLNVIGRITTAGVVSSVNDPNSSVPWGITAGSDGAVWFANVGNNVIGRISTAGVATYFMNPTVVGPLEITGGPDGALWFTNKGNDSIGRITTRGVVTNYTAATISSPDGITVGPDGALWFTNNGNNSIGRITTSRPEPLAIISADTVSATAGMGFTFSVSTTGTSVPTLTAKGTLPRGVAFVNRGSGTATIQGTPDQVGTYHLVITATFRTGARTHVVTQAFTLTVTAA